MSIFISGLALTPLFNEIVSNVTLEDGIEAALINEIPEVIKVVNES